MNKKYPLEMGPKAVRKVMKVIKCLKFRFLTTRRREQREKRGKVKNPLK